MDDYGDRQGRWLGLSIGLIAILFLAALLLASLDLAECERREGLIRLFNDRNGPRYSEVYPEQWSAWVRECRN